MDIDKQFAADAAKEKDGVWFDIGDGARVKVAAANNPNFQRIMRAKFKGKERQLTLKTLSNEVAETLLVESIAEAILVDWSGFERKGEPFAYSVNNAIDVLTHHKRLRDIVVALSEDFEAFKAEANQDTEKNSVTLSDSSLKTASKKSTS